MYKSSFKQKRLSYLITIRCWLSTEKYYIWSFAAPVILITVVSSYRTGSVLLTIYSAINSLRPYKIYKQTNK